MNNRHHVISFLPAKGAQASLGHAEVPSWALAAQREA